MSTIMTDLIIVMRIMVSSFALENQLGLFVLFCYTLLA